MSQPQNIETTISSKIEFFEANGNPTELDDTLLADYFKCLEGSVGRQSLPSPTQSTLDFSSNTRALTPFVSLSANGKVIFVAQQIESDMHIPGHSQVFGVFELGAPFNYKLNNIPFGFARLSIVPHDGSLNRIEVYCDCQFISSRPYKVPKLRGSGTIVNFGSLKAAK